eukprot:938412-Pyramimonas_sp.AAC.1
MRPAPPRALRRRHDNPGLCFTEEKKKPIEPTAQLALLTGWVSPQRVDALGDLLMDVAEPEGRRPAAPLVEGHPVGGSVEPNRGHDPQHLQPNMALGLVRHLCH